MLKNNTIKNIILEILNPFLQTLIYKKIKNIWYK